jgi:hypothetical protein
MSGKTMLIEHFIFNHPELFVFLRPYSNSLGKGLLEISNRDIIDGVHFNKATLAEINQWEKDGKTLFVKSDSLDVPATSLGGGGNA